MTKNVIDYLSYEEAKRSNLVNEEIARQQLAESKRHAQETEGISRFQQQEVQRHNIMSETLEQQKQSETARHDTMSELLTNQANAINASFNEGRLHQWSDELLQTKWMDTQTARLRAAELTEEGRHNLETESTANYNASANALAGLGNLTTRGNELAEQERHSRTTESQTDRKMALDWTSTVLRTITDISGAALKAATSAATLN